MSEITRDQRTIAKDIRFGPYTLTRGEFLRWVTVVSAVMAAATLYLNYHSALAGGIVHRFQNQAQIISHGFDPSLAVDSSTLTYPSWGYGWLYTMTQSRLVLMSFQMILGVVAGLLFVRVLARDGSNSLLLSTGILTAIAMPWYSLHATITLYSPSSALLACSIALLLDVLSRPERGMYSALASGLLFGLCLNFRSDFVMMPIGLAAIVLLFRPTRQSWKHMTVWGLSIAVMMVPWLLYTRHVAAAPRLTSTNGGHAMFIGLGQLPGNTWGITPTDEDPLTREIIDRELGPGASTLSVQADTILKREFRKRVADQPAEFAHKILYSGAKVVTNGAYPGEFLNTAEHRVRRVELIARCKSIFRSPIAYLRDYGVSQSLRTLLLMGLYASTIVIVLASFIAAPVNAWLAIRHGRLPVLLVVACIAYHWLLQASVFNLPQYTSCFLLFHIANLGFAWEQWTAFRQSRTA